MTARVELLIYQRVATTGNHFEKMESRASRISMDWFSEGKILTGNHRFSHEDQRGFPVKIFP